MDRPNRAFATFMTASIVAFVMLGMGVCVLYGIVGYRVQQDGVDALTVGGNDVRPALAFLAVVAAGLLAGIWSLRRQLLANRRLRQRVEALRLAPSPRLRDIAQRVGLADRTDLVDAAEPFSFTYGLGEPRVVVSLGLATSLSDAELEAVLEHERYHVRHHDPSKAFATGLLAPTLFFLPALRGLRTRYIAARELAADRRALRKHGRQPLAGALYKVVGSPTWVQLSPAAAIGGGDALDARVHQLETGAAPVAPRLSRLAVLVSAASACALAAGFLVSVFAFGGPSALARLCGGS